ncbi:hypothetical protein EDB19DRAFT_1702760 [Suillus lakei]|nr:hypothetical protein EDB19DRAFT_1702760 [Suillus lakei]
MFSCPLQMLCPALYWRSSTASRIRSTSTTPRRVPSHLLAVQSIFLPRNLCVAMDKCVNKTHSNVLENTTVLLYRHFANEGI